MRTFIFSRQAKRDVLSIWLYIAQDDVQAADAVEAAIVENCRLLAQFPGIGHLREDLTHRPALFWSAVPYSNYLIMYVVQRRSIRVLRILHGAQSRA